MGQNNSKEPLEGFAVPSAAIHTTISGLVEDPADAFARLIKTNKGLRPVDSIWKDFVKVRLRVEVHRVTSDLLTVIKNHYLSDLLAANQKTGALKCFVQFVTALLRAHREGEPNSVKSEGIDQCSRSPSQLDRICVQEKIMCKTGPIASQLNEFSPLISEIVSETSEENVMALYILVHCIIKLLCENYSDVDILFHLDHCPLSSDRPEFPEQAEVAKLDTTLHYIVDYMGHYRTTLSTRRAHREVDIREGVINWIRAQFPEQLWIFTYRGFTFRTTCGRFVGSGELAMECGSDTHLVLIPLGIPLGLGAESKEIRRLPVSTLMEYLKEITVTAMASQTILATKPAIKTEETLAFIERFAPSSLLSLQTFCLLSLMNLFSVRSTRCCVDLSSVLPQCPEFQQVIPGGSPSRNTGINIFEEKMPRTVETSPMLPRPSVEISPTSTLHLGSQSSAESTEPTATLSAAKKIGNYYLPNHLFVDTFLELLVAFDTSRQPDASLSHLNSMLEHSPLHNLLLTHESAANISPCSFTDYCAKNYTATSASFSKDFATFLLNCVMVGRNTETNGVANSKHDLCVRLENYLSLVATNAIVSLLVYPTDAVRRRRFEELATYLHSQESVHPHNLKMARLINQALYKENASPEDIEFTRLLTLRTVECGANRFSWAFSNVTDPKLFTSGESATKTGVAEAGRPSLDFGNLLGFVLSRIADHSLAVLLYQLMYRNRTFKVFCLSLPEPERMFVPIMKSLLGVVSKANGGSMGAYYFLVKRYLDSPGRFLALDFQSNASAFRDIADLPNALRTLTQVLFLDREAHQTEEVPQGNFLKLQTSPGLVLLVATLIQLSSSAAASDSLHLTAITAPDSSAGNIPASHFCVEVLLRVIRWNLKTHNDAYFIELCNAAFRNISRSLNTLHTYVAKDLLNLYFFMSKKIAHQLSTATPPNPPTFRMLLVTYTSLLSVLARLLSRSHINENIGLLYAFLLDFVETRHEKVLWFFRVLLSQAIQPEPARRGSDSSISDFTKSYEPEHGADTLGDSHSPTPPRYTLLDPATSALEIQYLVALNQYFDARPDEYIEELSVSEHVDRLVNLARTMPEELVFGEKNLIAYEKIGERPIWRYAETTESFSYFASLWHDLLPFVHYPLSSSFWGPKAPQ